MSGAWALALDMDAMAARRADTVLGRMAAVVVVAVVVELCRWLRCFEVEGEVEKVWRSEDRNCIFPGFI
jgi:hypothetical protein